MITWLPALLRIVGRIINGIMNVNAIKECRLLCDFLMRKVCYSEIKQEANRVRRMTLRLKLHREQHKRQGLRQKPPWLR